MSRRKFSGGFGTGQGPRTGPLPARIPSEDPYTEQRRVAGPRAPAKTIFVYGPPRVGVTTLVSILAHPETLSMTAFADAILAEPVDSLVTRVDGLRRDPKVTSVFVGGRPIDLDDIQALYNARLMDPIESIVVRVWRRSLADHREFGRQAEYMRQRLELLAVPHYMIPIDDPAQGAASLALRARLA